MPITGIDIMLMRRRANVRQLDLARALTIDVRRLSEYERDDRAIPRAFGERVREALRRLLQERLQAV